MGRKEVTINNTLWSISTLEAMAKSHGGKIIVDTNKVRWECSEGDRWEQDPNLILNGSWCPICEKKKRMVKQSFIKLVEVPSLFKGSKFELFAFDMNNLVTGWMKKFSNENIMKSDYFAKIDNFIPKSPNYNYLAYFFVSKYYEYIRPNFPTSYQNRWYIEENLKSGSNQDIMDIDATLTGCIASMIELYHDQITRFSLGSGDMDLHYVVDVAHKFHIPVTVISLDLDSLNTFLKKIADETILLY